MREKNFDSIDEFLINGIKSIELEECSDDEIRNIILKAKERKIKKKQEHLKLYKMVASFTFLIVIFAFSIYILSNDIDGNVITQLNDSYLNNNNGVEEEYIIYSISDPSSLDCRSELTLKEIYDWSEEIAIVKIDEVRGTNYDFRYEFHYNGDIGYTFVRTIGKLTVLDTIKGELKEGESVEFRKKGGRR